MRKLRETLLDGTNAIDYKNITFTDSDGYSVTNKIGRIME